MQTFETILTNVTDRVGLITLNRPDALNALNTQLAKDVCNALAVFDADPDVGCIIITGSAKAFAAGADIKEMADKSFPGTYLDDFITTGWGRFENCRKPIIAAVSGYALGGGCELAMMCDFILASDTAKFGQPEITLGIVPGIGGSQRLTRAVGKAKAMELILTGRMMDADEAERCGLVARVVPATELLEEAHKTAAQIAGYSSSAVLMAKELGNVAFETTLHEGIRAERRLFQACFGTDDQIEGMTAFLEKRKPKFEHK